MRKHTRATSFMFISFQPFLWFQVLLSFLLSLTSVSNAASSANLFSLLEPDSPVRTMSPKRPRGQPSQGRVIAIPQPSSGSIPIVIKADKKIGFLVVAEFINQTILQPFLEEYKLDPSKKLSWDYVLRMNRDVCDALGRVNANKAKKISPVVFADAIRLYRNRHQYIAHRANSDLKLKVATDHWRLIASSLPPWVKDEIEGLLQDNGLITLESNPNVVEDDGWNLHGGLEKNQTAIAIAAVELFEFIKKVIPKEDRSQIQNQAVNYLGRFRNRNAHPEVSLKAARTYARLLKGCTHHSEICDYILQQ